MDFRTRTIIGECTATKLWEYLSEYDNPHIVVDTNVYKTDYCKNIIANGHQYISEYRAGEPTYSLLNKCLDTHDYSQHDVFVGIGGGSVLDFTKAMAFLAENEGDATDYKGFPEEYNQPRPMIAIPTTTGTGSEMTYFASIIDTETQQKLGINCKDNFPDIAIIDPKFTDSCPEYLIISTAMDAMFHAIEAHSSKRSDIATKMFAKSAYHSLKEGLQSSELDRDARLKLMIGAYQAGISLLGSGGGPAGALQDIIGVRWHMSHSITSVIFLWNMIKWNDDRGYTYNELDDDVFGVIDGIYERYKLPAGLSNLELDEDDLDVILDDLEKNYSYFLTQNPIPFIKNNAEKMLREMI